MVFVDVVCCVLSGGNYWTINVNDLSNNTHPCCITSAFAWVFESFVRVAWAGLCINYRLPPILVAPIDNTFLRILCALLGQVSAAAKKTVMLTFTATPLDITAQLANKKIGAVMHLGTAL